MSFDPGSLIVSFIISGVGFILFSYGRKMERIPQVVAGLILMVFPYFVTGILAMLLVTLGIAGLLWAALWYGA